MVMTRSQSKEPPVEVLRTPTRFDREAPPSPLSVGTHSTRTVPTEQQHDNVPLSRPYRTCAGCTMATEAEVWCCECSRCLCWNCDERRHSSDTLDALRRPMCSHRVERIADGGGIPIFSGMLEIAVILVAGLMVRPLLSAASRMLSVDFFLDSVCPLTKRLRLVVFRMDHALYPLLRGTLGAWCDVEDSFLKLYVDVWVRGVLTKTDSFALLVMKIPSILGALIVVMAVAPLLAIPYAFVATLVRIIELLLIPNWRLFQTLSMVVRGVNVLLWAPLYTMGWFTRATVLGLIMDDEYREAFHRRLKIPPKTGHRIRPTVSDGIEDVSLGSVNRVTRIFRYFHKKARRTIVGVILSSVFVAFFIRIVLLALPRCGHGILSASSVAGLLGILNDTQEIDDASQECVSVHAMIRDYAVQVGIVMPDFSDLGEEAVVLAKLQDATEDDYIDQVLRLTAKSSYHRFLEYPTLVQVMICAVLASLCCAGVVRRIMHWWDLRRRYRYSAAMKNVQALNTHAVDADAAVESQQAGTIKNNGANQNESIAEVDEGLRGEQQEPRSKLTTQ